MSPETPLPVTSVLQMEGIIPGTGAGKGMDCWVSLEKWGDTGSSGRRAGDRDPHQATVTLWPHRQAQPLPFKQGSDRSAVRAK